MEKKDLCKKIKDNLNSLNQIELEEIFKMIYKSNYTNYSKNINGIYINISNLDENILIDIDNYINFCIKTHNEITKYENICNSYIEVINKDKQDESSVEIIEPSLKNKQKISSFMKFYLLKKKFAKNINNKNELYTEKKHLTYEEYLI
jgi:hypothetical protein